jgi:hypothetical protein
MRGILPSRQTCPTGQFCPSSSALPEEDAMDDVELTHQIGELVSEERRLRSEHPGLDDAARQRLADLEVQLDQCWDLLRQRRAREEFGEDPGAAKVRPADEVEGYRQ